MDVKLSDQSSASPLIWHSCLKSRNDTLVVVVCRLTISDVAARTHCFRNRRGGWQFGDSCHTSGMTESRPPAGGRIARAFSADRESPPLGGPTSFEEIYLTYAARLRTIAIRKFHVPPSEADTLVHDVFTTFFMHASSVHAVEPYLIA